MPRSDERIVFAAQSAERRIVDPVLLDEFELAGQGLRSLAQPKPYYLAALRPHYLVAPKPHYLAAVQERHPCLDLSFRANKLRKLLNRFGLSNARALRGTKFLDTGP